MFRPLLKSAFPKRNTTSRPHDLYVTVLNAETTYTYIEISIN
jgi:hypothetical protein